MTEDGWCATGFSAKLIVDKLEAFWVSKQGKGKLFIEKHCFH